jgi:hypothetical protein
VTEWRRLREEYELLCNCVLKELDRHHPLANHDWQGAEVHARRHEPAGLHPADETEHGAGPFRTAPVRDAGQQGPVMHTLSPLAVSPARTLTSHTEPDKMSPDRGGPFLVADHAPAQVSTAATNRRKWSPNSLPEWSPNTLSKTTRAKSSQAGRQISAGRCRRGAQPDR